MCCVYAYFTDLSKSAAAIPRGASGGCTGREHTEKSKRLSEEYIYIYYIIRIYIYIYIYVYEYHVRVCERDRRV